MAFMNRVASRLMASRGLTTSAARQAEVHPAYAKMKETSKLFQKNDGLGVSILNFLARNYS